MVQELKKEFYLLTGRSMPWVHCSLHCFEDPTQNWGVPRSNNAREERISQILHVFEDNFVHRNHISRILRTNTVRCGFFTKNKCLMCSAGSPPNLLSSQWSYTEFSSSQSTQTTIPSPKACSLPKKRRVL